MDLHIVREIAGYSAGALEIFGIAIIVLVGLAATFIALRRIALGRETEKIYSDYRYQFGHGILLGLEFLVAADIIHTVAVELTWTSVGVLAVIVLIRTFLSFTLEVEMTGYWPWQREQRRRGEREVG